MTKARLVLIGTAVSVAVCLGVAQEKRIQKKDLPPAVQKAVDANGKTVKK